MWTIWWVLLPLIFVVPGYIHVLILHWHSTATAIKIYVLIVHRALLLLCIDIALHCYCQRCIDVALHCYCQLCIGIALHCYCSVLLLHWHCYCQLCIDVVLHCYCYVLLLHWHCYGQQWDLYCTASYMHVGHTTLPLPAMDWCGTASRYVHVSHS